MQHPTPLEALCHRIALAVGPWSAMTPEAQQKADEEHQAALRGPFTLTGGEARQLAEVAAYALGMRYTQRNKDASTAGGVKAARERLFRALDAADEALGQRSKGDQP